MSDIFRHESTVWAEASPVFSMIRDLDLVDGANGPVLQLLTGPRPGLQLTAWGVSGSVSAQDSDALAGAGQAGVTPMLEPGQTASGREFTLVLGSGSTGLAGYWGDGQGGFGAIMPLGQAGVALPSDLVAVTVAEQAGQTYVYGLRPGSQTPIQWHLDDSGVLRLRGAGAQDAPVSGIPAPGLTDMAVIGDFLVVAGTGDALMRGYRINSDGTLSNAALVPARDNPGLGGPMVLEAARVDGQDYVITAASGSSTLTVWRVGTDGQLTLTEHLMDTLDSRFQTVTHLEVVTRADAVFVAAGGADQGISLFQLSPGGRLIHLGVATDSAEASLDGLAGMDLGLNRDDSLVLVTSGLADGGVSVLTHDPGPRGAVDRAAFGGQALTGSTGADLLEGWAGADTLTGGAGGDILIDGGGADRLTGGAGADRFVFVADGQTETVTDFNPSEDLLDLSGYAFFYSLDVLEITPTANGAVILFDGPATREEIRLVSFNSTALDPDVVRAAIVAGPQRLLPDWPDLLPEPPPPSGEPRLFSGSPENDRLLGGLGGDTVNGAAGSDWLEGGRGDDLLNGGIGFDTVLGDAGNDTLLGLDGYDDLRGGSGNDRLTGNNGLDTLQGEGGDDSLSGGIGADSLVGGDGADTLQGDAGPDGLWGGAGADLQRGNAGADLLEGGDGDDRLEGGINFDTLSGGAGNDLLIAGNGSDSLSGGAGADTLYGNSGADTLEGGAGDILNGGIGPDQFVFRGGGGRVVIQDFQNNFDTLALDRALWDGVNLSYGQMLARYARQDGADVVLDFGAQGEVVLERLATITALQDDLAFL